MDAYAIERHGLLSEKATPLLEDSLSSTKFIENKRASARINIRCKKWYVKDSNRRMKYNLNNV